MRRYYYITFLLPSEESRTERYKDKYLAKRRISEIEENGGILLEFKYE